MEKFLEKIQLEIENKMIACIKGESIIKPFTQIYHEVREKIQVEQNKNTLNNDNGKMIYTKGEGSIYAAVVSKFLEEHPELKQKNNKDNNNEEN